MTTIKLKCVKHPTYDAARGGQNAIRGGCVMCHRIWRAYTAAYAAMRATAEDAPPWDESMRRNGSGPTLTASEVAVVQEGGKTKFVRRKGPIRAS